MYLIYDINLIKRIYQSKVMLYPKYSKNTKTQMEAKIYQAKLLDILNKIDGETFGNLFEHLKHIMKSTRTLWNYLKYLEEEGLIKSKNKRYIITNKGAIHLAKLREQEHIGSMTSTHTFMTGTNNKDHTAPTTTTFLDMHSQQRLEPDEEEEMKKIINECGEKISNVLSKGKIKNGAIIYHFK